jgi:hypothetical protein
MGGWDIQGSPSKLAELAPASAHLRYAVGVQLRRTVQVGEGVTYGPFFAGKRARVCTASSL